MYLAKHSSKRRTGTVVIIAAISMVVILSVVAIALDGGLMLDYRRRSQNAADAAAMGATKDLYSGTFTTAQVKTRALTTAAGCGFSNDGTTNTVTINIPPLSGHNKGNSNSAEVITTWYLQSTFSRIFGNTTNQVSARAVGTVMTAPADGYGVIVLDPTAQKALNVTGDGNLTVKSGTVIDDSNSSQALILTGNGGITANQLIVTGTGPGWSHSGSGTIVTSPTDGNIQTGVSRTSDPLASLPAPVSISYTTQSSSQLNINTTQTLQPGRYVGGISISGGTITLQPGIYYMDHGGFSVSNGTVNGTGVMIYNDPQPGSGQKVTITGGSFNLSAPQSGTYQGIVIFQARDAGSTSVAITGPSGSQLIGAVYAPNSPVTATGGGATIIGSEFISDTLTITGPGNFNVDYNGTSRPAVRTMYLTE